MSTAEADVRARLHAPIDPNTGPRSRLARKPCARCSSDGSDVTIDLQPGCPAKRQHHITLMGLLGQVPEHRDSEYLT